jgi:hypothetical protein
MPAKIPDKTGHLDQANEKFKLAIVALAKEPAFGSCMLLLPVAMAWQFPLSNWSMMRG